VLTNTLIAAGDTLVLNHVSGGTPGSYTLNARCANGSATIDVRNNTAGSLSRSDRVSVQPHQGRGRVDTARAARAARSTPSLRRQRP
jgi:hypothetical protein